MYLTAIFINIKKTLQDMRKGAPISIINQGLVDKNGKPCDMKTEGSHLIKYKRPLIKRYKNKQCKPIV